MSDPPTKQEKVFKEYVKRSIETERCMLDSYVLSLSTNKDSNLLWSNYANNDGYNIELDYSKLLNILYLSEEDYNSYCHMIIYDPKVQKDWLKKELINLYKVFLYAYDFNGDKDAVYHKYGTDTLLSIFLYSIFFKAACFNQEEEFRVAIIEPNFDYKYKCRISNGVFIPYVELPLIEKNGISAIKSTTIGPKNNLDIAEKGLKYFLEINRLKGVEIRKSEIPYRY